MFHRDKPFERDSLEEVEGEGAYEKLSLAPFLRPMNTSSWLAGMRSKSCRGSHLEIDGDGDDFITKTFGDAGDVNGEHGGGYASAFQLAAGAIRGVFNAMNG